MCVHVCVRPRPISHNVYLCVAGVAGTTSYHTETFSFSQHKDSEGPTKKIFHSIVFCHSARREMGGYGVSVWKSLSCERSEEGQAEMTVFFRQ